MNKTALITSTITSTITSIITKYSLYAIGPIIGLCAFIYGLVTLENVLWRMDSDGKVNFSHQNLWEYIKLPFNSTHWRQNWGLLPNISMITRLTLLNLNWVAMVGVGSLISIGFYYFGKSPSIDCVPVA